MMGTGSSLSVVPLDPPVGYRLVGEIDLATRPVLLAVLRLCVGPADVHLDLSGLVFVDVAGAEDLVHHAARVGPPGRLVLDSPPPMLDRIIRTLWGEQSSIVMRPRQPAPSA